MHHHHEEICKMTKDTHQAKEYFLRQLAFTMGPGRLKHLMEEHLEEYTLFDLREYEDYVKGHIPFAIHIPYDQLDEQLVKFSKDKVNILYSYSPLCQRSKKVAFILADKDYPVRELTGGFKGWKKRGFDIVENDMSDYPG